MGKKVISVLIPTFNEEENAIPIYQAVKKVLAEDLPQYDYEILFIDNKSKDNTREKIAWICNQDSKVRAIFNVKNFGQFNSPYYGLINTSGDCVISLCADFQDPVDMIPKFVSEWEKGYKIVCAIKTHSKENKIMYFLRGCYYKLIHSVSSAEMIEHFTGFGLYDKSFIDVLRSLKDPTPFYRGLVAELGFDRKEIEYTQQKRRAGKTSNNWSTLYDAAMLSFTSYTKIGLRIPAILGSILAFICVIIAVVILGVKIFNWNDFDCGGAFIADGLFFIGSIQLIFIGILGEYILALNERLKNRPLVVEEKRLNFNISEENQ